MNIFLAGEPGNVSLKDSAAVAQGLKERFRTRGRAGGRAREIQGGPGRLEAPASADPPINTKEGLGNRNPNPLVIVQEIRA